MGIARQHSRALPTTQSHKRSVIGSLHGQPTGKGMSEVMKSKRSQFCAIYGFLKGSPEIAGIQGKDSVLKGNLRRFLHIA
ncbi:MAG: hypothetical protein O7F12_01080 [Nitrospirae bacterium]|nr:hypothetical protein [Nitrospirota bacterium]